ncbi:MAG: hypothetical protein GC185_12345 [Alphaproteobacteria bacterium]|nr:hypothetical protein [Alphaproteobacteria bacterium]
MQDRSLRDIFEKRTTEIAADEDAVAARRYAEALRGLVVRMQDEGFHARVGFRPDGYRSEWSDGYGAVMNGEIMLDDLKFPFLLKRNYKASGTYLFSMRFDGSGLVYAQGKPEEAQLAEVVEKVAERLMGTKAEVDFLGKLNVSDDKAQPLFEAKPVFPSPRKPGGKTA